MTGPVGRFLEHDNSSWGSQLAMVGGFGLSPKRKLGASHTADYATSNVVTYMSSFICNEKCGERIMEYYMSNIYI